MVRICEDIYPEEREVEYKHYYEQYPYKLHDFQKWCIEAVATGNNCLLMAATGSGKTFGGDFAISYFNSIGKKVIYCSPIKALSNEKYYLFIKKYPNISIGIATGDQKVNTDADVIIMTTEILLNKLYQINNNQQNIKSIKSINSFEIDIENDLGCVVFDEMHYVLDENRGHIWEQCLMLLPEHVQIIGLSATLDNPEKFASWLESNKIYKDNIVKKQVYLAKKEKRAVPLIHYSFITSTNTINKHIKDKETQQEIKHNLDKLFVIQDEYGNFKEEQYKNITKVLQLFEKHDIRVKRQHVLNKVCEYLVEKEMLPALCYVFSRKQVEQFAEEITTTLLEFDSKIPYTIDYECEKIIRKLPNYEEYFGLPEYINTVKLLRKGIGMHHAGLMAPLREMTELLFGMGYIKILFCTETMAVGINLAVKSVIFTDIYKYNGTVNRLLYSHEYTQASGRSGRLGYDTVGHVIHLNNLFRNIDYNSYRTMMNGKPQKLISKFKISYNLILNLIATNNNNDNNNIVSQLVEYSKKSMIQYDLDNKATGLAKQLSDLEADASRLEEAIKTITIPSNIMDEYVRLVDMLPFTVNKKRKECEKDLQKITNEYKNIANERALLKKFIDKKKEIVVLNKSINDNQYYLDYNVDRILHVLTDEQLLDPNTNQLTIRGQIAASIRELPCLPFAAIIEDGTLNTLTEYDLISVFSCFTNVTVGEEWSTTCLSNVKTSESVISILKTLDISFEKFQDIETRLMLDTGVDYSKHYNMIEYAYEWAQSENVEQCKWVLQLAAEEKEIFLGEFVKAILKIVAISAELESIAEMLGQIDFLFKLRQIPILLMKYVATNQSLYI
jgi:superfamily II RNA helicase